MTVASDGVVTLRQLLPSDSGVLMKWDRLVAKEQPFNYFGGLSGSAAHEDGETGTGFGAADITRLMACLVDRTIIGDVSWHRVGYGPNQLSSALNIGIGLQTPFRGQGYGTRVQRLLARHLFESTGVFRVEASTDVDNIAEQRALAKAGFAREGVLRGAQYRLGAFHDLVIFSRLRSD